jgi:hypothetical protein
MCFILDGHKPKEAGSNLALAPSHIPPHGAKPPSLMTLKTARKRLRRNLYFLTLSQLLKKKKVS